MLATVQSPPPAKHNKHQNINDALQCNLLCQLTSADERSAHLT